MKIVSWRTTVFLFLSVFSLACAEANQPPQFTSVTFDKTTVAVNEFVTYAATASDPDGDTPLTIIWNVGNAFPNVSNGGIFSFQNTGVHTILAAVEDGHGGVSWRTYNFNVTPLPAVANRPPVLTSMTASKTTAAVKEGIWFSATTSDPDGDPVGVTWIFGDSFPNSALGTLHSFQQEGDYTVLAVAQDGRGGLSSNTLTIHVVASSGGTSPGGGTSPTNGGGPTGTSDNPVVRKNQPALFQGQSATIYTIHGRRLGTIAGVNGTVTCSGEVNGRSLAAGSYIVDVKTLDGKTIRKTMAVAE